MKIKEYLVVPLFEQFIKDSASGKRLKPDGTVLKKGSITNYKYVLSYLKAYEAIKQINLRLKIIPGINTRLFMQEKKILG